MYCIVYLHLMKSNMPVVLSMLSPELHLHSSVSKLQSGNLTPGWAVVVVSWSTLQPIRGEHSAGPITAHLAASGWVAHLSSPANTRKSSTATKPVSSPASRAAVSTMFRPVMFTCRYGDMVIDINIDN